MKDDRLYLLHIVECIVRVEEYTAGGEQAFLSSTLVQDAVIRNLQVLAESTQRLSGEIKAAHSAIDWRGIAGFRNVLTHNHLGVDVARVWEVTARDLPPLKSEIEVMLNETLES